MKTTFKRVGRPGSKLYIRQPIGVFYARLYINGNTKWVSLETTVRTRADSEIIRVVNEHNARRNAEHQVKKGDATMGDLADIYLKSQELRQLKPKSKKSRRDTLDALVRSWPDLMQRKPASVSLDECRKWSRDWALSASFFNNTLDSLRGIFNVAIAHGLITSNPIDRKDNGEAAVPRHKRPVKQMIPPTSEQFAVMIAHIRRNARAAADGSGDLVEFLTYSGMRIAEARQVQWRDIAWTDKDQTQGRIRVVGKNDKIRHIPIIPEMAELLRRIAASPRWVRSETRRAGDYVMSVRQCEQSLTSACIAAGVPRMTHHDLRHYFASVSLKTTDIATLSNWLGHSDGGVIAFRIYGHLIDKHSQDMAQKVRFS